VGNNSLNNEEMHINYQNKSFYWKICLAKFILALQIKQHYCCPHLKLYRTTLPEESQNIYIYIAAANSSGTIFLLNFMECGQWSVEGTKREHAQNTLK
jgi:hypothetical protein